MEIADCQGSDSPNPIHLNMIQDYLLLTHMIIYVISSRTGVRQADIKFLSMIRKMGIMENMLFVINADFNEHSGLDDLQRLVGKVGDELAIIHGGPDLFCLSALYELFSTTHEDLSTKDRLRLEQWQSETPFVDYNSGQWERFLDALQKHTVGGRSTLLLDNHLERLRVFADGIANWANACRGLMAKDAQQIEQISGKIQQHHQKVGRVEAMIRTTLDGAVPVVKKEIRDAVDRFFDRHRKGAVDRLLSFVRSYEVAYGEYEEQFRSSGFASTMFLVYQNFKQQVDRFMAEEINPEIFALYANWRKKPPPPSPPRSSRWTC
jgi:hypothetical protein